MNEEYMSCVICHEKFRNGVDIYCTTCGHVFHQPCIRSWLDRAGTCPECRAVNPTIHRLYLNVADPTNLEEEVRTLRQKTESDAETIALLTVDFNESNAKQGELQKQLDEYIIKCSNIEYDCNQKVLELKNQLEENIIASSQQQDNLERQLEECEIKYGCIEIEYVDKDTRLRNEIEEHRKQQLQLIKELEKYMQKCSSMECQELEIEAEDKNKDDTVNEKELLQLQINDLTDQKNYMETHYTGKIKKLDIQLEIILDRVIELEDQLKLAFVEKTALEAQVKLQVESNEPNNKMSEDSTCDGQKCSEKLHIQLKQCILNCSVKEKKIVDLNEQIQYLTEQSKQISAKLKQEMLKNHTLEQSLKTSKMVAVSEENDCVVEEKHQQATSELKKSMEYITLLKNENEQLQKTLLHMKIPYMYENLFRDSVNFMNFRPSSNDFPNFFPVFNKSPMATSILTNAEEAKNEPNKNASLMSSNEQNTTKNENSKTILSLSKGLRKCVSSGDITFPVIASSEDEYIEPNTAVVIKGIPKHENPGNWVMYVLTLAAQATVLITESDIKRVTILKTQRGNYGFKGLVVTLRVQFQSTAVKDKFLDVRSKIRNNPMFSTLTIHEYISFPQNRTKMQNMDHNQNKPKAFDETLLNHAKSLKSIKFYSVYCINSRIFTKRTKCSKPIEITSMAQIDDLKREYHAKEANKSKREVQKDSPINHKPKAAKNDAGSSETAPTSIS
ncbi:uncharacterized protein LOC119688089 [Teleopsis dalmanni]|uniref:uncharacterized protein LOC119688089 n=1 Tax=Teleopsis dalmanni TaxID=139649 RepID=UPI0018CEE44E|nr:uncharacterized protein LOC119688089 [Teleopsis dalmanni]